MAYYESEYAQSSTHGAEHCSRNWRGTLRLPRKDLRHEVLQLRERILSGQPRLDGVSGGVRLCLELNERATSAEPDMCVPARPKVAESHF